MRASSSVSAMITSSLRPNKPHPANPDTQKIAIKNIIAAFFNLPIFDSFINDSPFAKFLCEFL
jgi:hypothetical protein